MANTVTQRTLMGGGKERNVIRLIHILSDGTQESGTVIYDNSAFVNDVTKGNLWRVWVSGSDSIIRLEWDQTTKSPAYAANPVNAPHPDFSKIGGIKNPNGTGATGDLLLTTSGLAANEEVFIIIEIKQS